MLEVVLEGHAVLHPARDIVAIHSGSEVASVRCQVSPSSAVAQGIDEC